MDRKVLTRCKRRLRNSLWRENCWVLIKSRVLQVKTTVDTALIRLQVEIFGKLYCLTARTFNLAAQCFLEQFFADYSSYAIFQGTKMVDNNDAAIIARMIAMSDEQGALTVIKDAKFKLSTLSKVADDPRVKQIVEDTVDEMGHREIYDAYHRTDEVTDANLHAEGLLVHFSPEGNRDYCLDTEDVLDMLLDAWAHETPYGECVTAVSPMDPLSLAKIKVNDTSAGNFSSSVIKKKLCGVEVAGIVARQAQIGRAKTAPAKPCQKLEVIKKVNSRGVAKKVRAIQSDSADNSLASEAVLGSFVRLSRGVEGGSAIGVPTNKAFGLRLFTQLTSPFSNCLTYREEQAVERGIHESDMQCWEATTKQETALAYTVLAISAVDDLSQAGAVAANVLANYYHPFFSISGEQACSKRGVTSSGSKPTAHGNTVRHRFMLSLFKLYVRRHGFSLGLAGCSCKVCKKMQGHPDFGKKVDYVELALIICAILMGDDFEALWTECAAFYDNYCDEVFGTVHTTERKGLWEGAFLKRRLKKVRGWFTTHVPHEYVIPKFKGPGMMTAENKMCACINAAFNSNNKVVYDFAKRLYYKLEVEYGRSRAVDEQLKDDYKGTPECVGFPTWEMCESKHLPTAWDVMAINANRKSVMLTNLPSQVSMAIFEEAINEV
uniref:Putative RNA dependent RNA polymerase n=1 Tax=Laitoushanzui virus TaxID=2656657 RepID=A0A5P8PP37_9VIRU|nr:MAG: putative RNA dependent RNA polymerase [Laitoushanzui virus]